MIETSNEFKTAVYSPIRIVKGKVTFDISDVTAKNDISNISVTTEAVISNKDQLINKKREQSINIATWEKDRFKLDGSFSFADDIMINNGELGFVSENLSDENGNFALFPTLIFSFNDTHASVGITLTFDVLNNEYATEFVVNAYDSSNNLFLTKEIINNDNSQVAIEGHFYQYKKIEIIIKKWCKPYRRCRIAEVDFGIVRVYTDNELIKMDLIKEMDIITSNLPSDEFRFTVDNLNKEFNILNPDGFYKYLQERQMIIPEIGLVIGKSTEYVKLGEFFLMDWISDEGSLTTTFTGRNIIDLIATYEYENLDAKANYSLYDMAKDIFNLCGITNYEIDEALKSISTKGLVKKTNCRDVLQMIAIASMSNILVDINNRVIIKRIELEDAVDIIRLDNMPKKPKIELENMVKTIEVAYYSDLDNYQVYILNNQVDKGSNIKVQNTLINDLNVATNVANWLLSRLSLRAKYTVNWRGNPAHELSDTIIIEDAYNQNNKAIITKIELTYTGGLKGKTEARGLVT